MNIADAQLKQMDQENKKDAGKSRMDLVPPKPLLEIGQVLGFGAEKYTEGGWKNVDPKRYRAAALRHILAHFDGNKYDEESGLTHLAHAATNLFFLMELENNV